MMIQKGRPLGARERFFWLVDQQRPVHFTMAAEVIGKQSSNQWHQGLAAIQRQHPLLSVAIRLDKNRSPEFIVEPGKVIPFKIVNISSPNEWLVRLEEDATQRFDSTSAPLLRATLYESDSRSVIALTAHHAISDGLSLSFVLRDLLNAMNGKFGRIHRLPPALDSYTDVPYNAASRIPVSDEMINAFNQQPPKAWPKPQIGALELSKDLSARIIARSREERTTVHGALCAALIWVSKNFGRNPIRVYSPVSVRETVGAGDSSCVSIVSRIVPFDTGNSGSFWETARYVKHALAGANSIEELNKFIGAMLKMIPEVHDFKQLDHLIDTRLAHEFLLSNLGHLPFETEYGQLKLQAIWGPFILTGYNGSQSLGAATINGSIRLTLTSPGNSESKPVLRLLEQILYSECPEQ